MGIAREIASNSSCREEKHNELNTCKWEQCAYHCVTVEKSKIKWRRKSTATKTSKYMKINESIIELVCDEN